MSRKREYKKKMKALEIMSVAEALFLKKPYNAITVDEIARMSGITKRTLYAYFPSKLALFTRMFDDYLQKLNHGILEIIDQHHDAKETVFHIINYLHDFSKQNERFMRLFWSLDSDEFNGELPQDLVQSINLWNRSMIDMVVAVIKKGQQAGVIMDKDPEMIVHVISSFNKGIFVHTNKEAKLNIANVDTTDLNRMFWDLIHPTLFPGNKN
jgi:AcrR family transcriptional regulator